MAGEKPAVMDGQVVSNRIAMRTMAQRRWRVVRSTVLFVIVTIAMVIMVKLHRDAGLVRRCRDTLTYVVHELERLPKHTALPLVLPLPPQPEEGTRARREEATDRLRDHYRYVPTNANLLSIMRPVVICYCREPHGMTLRADVRLMILYDGEHYELREMPEAEFRQQAERFGVHLPSK